MLISFWVLLGLILLIYAGYPLLSVVIAMLRPTVRYKPFEKLPKVSIVIAAHNEEQILAEKIENLFKLDYPRELVEIVVASDGSTDRTNEIALSYADKGVRLLKVEPQAGKTNAMNLAIHFTDADILIYTDADPMLERSALQRLVAYFSDERVGVVCANPMYGKGEKHLGAEQEGVYWKFENWIKFSESRAYNCIVGGTGELFAVRRTDAFELPDNINHDIMVQVMMRAKGKHVLFEPRAMAFSLGSKQIATEYRRKVRIVFQTAYSLIWASETLNPFKHFTLAYQLWVHKVLRWFSGLWLLPLLPLSYLLQDEGPFYEFFFYGISVFYGMAIVGYFLSKMRIRMGAFGLPFYVNLVYIAALHGVIKLLWDRPAASWRVDRNSELHSTH